MTKPTEDRPEASRRLVLVDIDGTLVTGMGTEKRFYMHLLRTGNQGPRQLLAYCYYFLRWGPRFRGRTLKTNKAYLAWLRPAKIERLAEAWVDTLLEDALYSPMAERIRQHQADGDHVVLLSGTLDVIGRAIGRRLGIDSCYASVCATAGEHYSHRPPEVHPFAESKLNVARTISAATGLPLEQAAAYGDSCSDLALLRAVGQPVAVRPDQSLAVEARRRGWEILGSRPSAASKPRWLSGDTPAT